MSFWGKGHRSLGEKGMWRRSLISFWPCISSKTWNKFKAAISMICSKISISQHYFFWIFSDIKIFFKRWLVKLRVPESYQTDTKFWCFLKIPSQIPRISFPLHFVIPLLVVLHVVSHKAVQHSTSKFLFHHSSPIVFKE